jgi:hypothetical protein
LVIEIACSLRSQSRRLKCSRRWLSDWGWFSNTKTIKVPSRRSHLVGSSRMLILVWNLGFWRDWGLDDRKLEIGRVK